LPKQEAEQHGVAIGDQFLIQKSFKSSLEKLWTNAMSRANNDPGSVGC